MQRNQNDGQTSHFPWENSKIPKPQEFDGETYQAFRSCSCVRRHRSIEVAVTIQRLRNWQTNTPQEGQEHHGTALNFLVSWLSHTPGTSRTVRCPGCKSRNESDMLSKTWAPAAAPRQRPRFEACRWLRLRDELHRNGALLVL